MTETADQYIARMTDAAMAKKKALDSLITERNLLDKAIRQYTACLRAICPHPESHNEHRRRSCAEDDGPFDTCKICGYSQ